MSIQEKFNVIEKLFLEEKFDSIVSFWLENVEDLNFCETRLTLELAESLSLSFIEVENFQQALFYIDSSINYLLDENKQAESNENINFIDDITTFYKLKIIVYQNTKKLLNECKAVNSYLMYRQDEDILELKNGIEDYLIYKYYRLNKFVLIIIIVLTSLLFIESKYINHKLLFIIIPIPLVWLIVNYFFSKKVNLVLNRIINRLLFNPS